MEEEFSFIGIVERFNESILILGRQLKWKPFLYQFKNVGRRNTPPSPGIREKILPLVKNDQVIYDWAIELYEKRRAQEPNSLQDALIEFEREINAIASCEHFPTQLAEKKSQLLSVENYFAS